MHKILGGVGTAAFVLLATGAGAHTNSVGFKLNSSSATTCVGGGGTTCYDVEVFYGSWHTGSLGAEGQLALFYQLPGGGEVQVVGPSASGGSATPFAMSHSLTGTIPNGLTSSADNYGTAGTSNYGLLTSVFTPGSDYFFTDGSFGDTTLDATPGTQGIYSHQSAIGIGLGPGTYRIAYDAASGALSATWEPVPAVQNATFTITGGGGITVDTGGAPTVSLEAPAGPVSGPFTVTATFSEDVTGVDLSDFVLAGGTASNLVQVSPGVYTITVTPSGTGGVSIELPADSAVDGDTNGNFASNTLNVAVAAPTAPTVALTGPSETVDGPFTVTATFSQDVTGVELSDFVVANGTASNLVQVSPDVYTFTVTPNGPGAVDIDLPANQAENAGSEGNAASNTLTVMSAVPPTLSDAEKEAIAATIRAEELKTLRIGLDTDRRMVRAARDRFIATQRCRRDEDADGMLRDLDLGCDDLLTQNVPLDFDGTAQATDKGSMLDGTFFGLTATSASSRRLVFGDFTVLHDDDTGTIASLDGRVAWEHDVSSRSMLGYFVGLQLSHSNVRGAFDGDRDRVGIAGGVYGVHDLGRDLAADGFVTLTYGHNSIGLDDDALAVSGDYNSTALHFGVALTGQRAYQGFDLRPELAVYGGYADMGDIDVEALIGSFTISDNIDIGHVAYSVLSATPEIILPRSFGGMFQEGEFRFLPSLLCEYVRSGTSETECGAALEFGVAARSNDGLTEIRARVRTERVGSSQRNIASINFERRF